MSHEFLDPKKDAQASENQQPNQQKVDVAAQMKWLDFLAHPERNTNPDDILDNNTLAQRFAKDEEEERSQSAQAKVEPSQQRKAMEEEELQQKPNPTGGSSGSTQMPKDVKQKMEGSFGTDFSGVNIHKDSGQANDIGALAYTQGNDIHFAPGEYNPGSQKGHELLGHELTHVVQQREGRVKPDSEQPVSAKARADKINSDPTLEKEVDDMGTKAAQGKMGDVATLNSAFSKNSQQIQLKTPKEKIQEFQSKTYSQSNFTPSTGIGLFDVSLNPLNGRLEIKVNVNFNFVNGIAGDFVGHKGESKKWSKEEILKWKQGFITLIEGRWGGKYHFINPSLPGISVYADVVIGEVAKDWHYQLNITKIPKGEWKSSSISHYIDSSKNALKQKNKHYGTLDSEDLSWSDKGAKEKQKGAVHEFGHMIGLGDEYSDGQPGITHASIVKTALGTVLSEGTSNDIMSAGNSIEKQHYITFLEALQKITADSTWKYKP